MNEDGDSGSEAKPPGIIENPMAAWVRGGSTTSAWDHEVAKQKEDADARRAAEDKRTRLAEQHPLEARQNTLSLGGSPSHAAIVLQVKHPKDNVVLDYIKCELIVEPDGNLQLNLACYQCARRGITDNFKISQRNRHFELDTRCQGDLWINPRDPNDIVTLAGAINLTEWVKCPNLGCGVTFTIDNNVIRTR